MSQLQPVLWIASVGGLLLFAATAGLVGLMYLLTSPLLSGTWMRAAPAPAEPVEPTPASDDPERRRRAVAVAVAVACADADRLPVSVADEPSDWRLLHRSLRLQQRVVARGAGR